jgi:hypothetical protein
VKSTGEGWTLVPRVYKKTFTAVSSKTYKVTFYAISGSHSSSFNVAVYNESTSTLITSISVPPAISCGGPFPPCSSPYYTFTFTATGTALSLRVAYPSGPRRKFIYNDKCSYIQ